MEKKKVSYEELIDTLRSYPPVMENPDVVTEAILKRIDTPLPVAKKHRIGTRTVWFSGVAAGILMAFLIHELWFVEIALSSPVLSYTSTTDYKQPACRELAENKDVYGLLRCYLKEKEEQEEHKRVLFNNFIK